MADPSEVGKYGTIRLLKRREPSAVVAAYPIDDDEVSFGRDASCSVRLYYPEVSPVHCRIVFEERKAFLQVLGAGGVIVDGCPVYPAKPAAPGNPPTTVTVPLPNGSIFEVHKKRFMFNYPPKALRPQLFTPATARRKSIRMSLVQSALVFSPAPSPHPRENLRVLQSPLKLESAEPPVTLVDGDHPRVYEEEQDLIILEDVEPSQSNGRHSEAGMSPTPMRLQTLPAAPQGSPKTPRRRSAPSLHRAVLIRSAQRIAYMRESQAQMQRQRLDYGPQFEEINLEEEDAEEDAEEDEEDEVINSILNASEEAEEEMASGEGTEEMALDSVEYDEEAVEVDEQDITEAHEEYREGEEGPQLTTPLQVSRALHLGAFMTPQPALFAKRSEDNRNERRKTGPQRPPPGFRFSLAPGLGADSMVIKEENTEEGSTEEKASAMPTSPTKRQEITEEERKAILERRRSALKAPDPVIGESILRLGEHRPHNLPPSVPAAASPFKTLSTHIEEGEDTQIVLQRMQAQVAERRASLSPTRPRISRDIGRGMLPPSPQKAFSLLASGTRLGSPARGMPDFEDGIMEETQNKLGKHDSMDVDDAHADAGADKNQDEENMEENDENARPTRAQPRTPRLDGLREMFRGPSATAGLATPAVRGVRDLFRAPEALQTPRMEGVRQLFAEKRVPDTPAFDGIGDMMHVDEQEQAAENVEADDTNERNVPVDVPEDVSDNAELAGVQRPAPTRKLPLAARTLSRSKAPRPAFIRTRGTPTDVSTMADDEATPDSAPLALPKRLKANKGAPEAAVVHRTGRTRRGAGAGSDTESSKATSSGRTVPDSGEQETPAKSAPRRGRPPKAKAEETEPEQEPPAKPPSKSRGRRKAGSAATATETEAGVDVAQPARRGTRAGSAQPEEAAPTPVTRRSTRARSRSADPESDDNAETIAERGSQAKAATVETIPEEEEPVSAQAQPARKAGAIAGARTRRTRTRTESSADDAPPKKRAGPSSSSVASRRTAKTSPVESTGEDAMHKEDKENTPEPSPVSESGEDASTGLAKPASKGRAATKNAETALASKAKAALGAPGRTKPASRTSKVKSEEEPVPVPRATRARARK